MPSVFLSTVDRPLMPRILRHLAVPLVLLWTALPASAQQRPTLTLERLFASAEFFGDFFRGGTWADEGPVLRYVEADRQTGATSLVEWNLETDERRTLIDGRGLRKPDGDGGLLEIEDYAYSRDGSKVLLYTDAERVWRLATRGRCTPSRR